MYSYLKLKKNIEIIVNRHRDRCDTTFDGLVIMTNVPLFFLVATQCGKRCTFKTVSISNKLPIKKSNFIRYRYTTNKSNAKLKIDVSTF